MAFFYLIQVPVQADSPRACEFLTFQEIRVPTNEFGVITALVPGPPPGGAPPSRQTDVLLHDWAFTKKSNRSKAYYASGDTEIAEAVSRATAEAL